ncbi:hypothetical protein [Roseovarius sp. A-2]|uniref:hypothetical protein n=1 Tax=Roseovarius sp. A-2 TaxID=1570360 RepID=UPI00111B5DF1|nr:hypothetical protein [Roseovarius sp. A-2]
MNTAKVPENGSVLRGLLVDFARHAAPALVEHIAREMAFQITIDGSAKMPQRVFAAIPNARAKGRDTRAFAFATAAVIRHLSLSTHDGTPYELHAPPAPTP